MKTALLVNTGPLQLTKTFYVNGTGTDQGDVTIGIVDAAGNTIVAAGTATTNAGAGVYTYPLPRASELTEYYVTWTVTSDSQVLVDVIEIVGDYLFTEAQARAKTISGLQTPLSDEGEYPDSVIADARRVIVDTFESRLGRASVPRYCRVEMAGNGKRRISVASGVRISDGGELLARPGAGRDVARVISCTIDGVAQSVSDLVPVGGGVIANKAGEFTYATDSDPLNVVLEYVYGPSTVDPEATERGLELLLANIIPTDLGGAEIASQSNPGGTTFRLTTYPKRVSEWFKMTRGDLPAF